MKAATKVSLFAVAAITGAACAHAADAPYPNKAVRMIVPFAPGGPTDVIARVVAAKLSEAWNNQVVVDNRAGAGGNIGMGMAASATPDGYTIAVVSSSYVVNPSLYAKIPYDPFTSFVPVTNIAASPNVFVAHPSVPAKTMQDLVAVTMKDGKKYSVATPGVGTTPDLSAELFKMTAKIDIVRVPFGGAGPAVASVIGNQVPLGCVAMPPATPHIVGGRLRGLAVTSAKRSAALPDVPTMAEAGFKGQEADTLQGVFVPAGTSKAIVTKIAADIKRMMAQPETIRRVQELGFDIVASTPEEFTAQVKSEVEKWGRVIKASGLKAE